MTTVRVPGGRRCRAPSGPAVLLAVTVNGQTAAVGAYQPWLPLRDVSGLAARRHGRDILVTWVWPDGVEEVEIRWRAAEGDRRTAEGDRHTAEGEWHTAALSRARYETDGGFVIYPPNGARVAVVVAPVVRSGSRRLVAGGRTVVVDVPVSVRYRLSFGPFWCRHTVVVTLTAEQDVEISELRLVAAPGLRMPLTEGEGDILARAWGVKVGPGTPARLQAVAPPRGRRPYWLRCFALGGTVDLHDPPVKRLLVR